VEHDDVSTAQTATVVTMAAHYVGYPRTSVATEVARAEFVVLRPSLDEYDPNGTVVRGRTRSSGCA
jgi:hypothetical protein